MAYILSQTCRGNLHVWLSEYEVLVPPGVKMG